MATEKESNFPERLRKFRKDAGLSQEAMAKKLGISGDYVYQIEAKLKTAGETVQLLFQILESSPIYGKIKPDGTLPEVAPTVIPGLSVIATCDDPRAFAMGVTYESMAPTMNAGDFVILTPSENPRHGEIVGAKHKMQGEMIRIYNEEPGNLVRLSAINPSWRDLVDSRDSFEWIYPVHSMVRTFRRPNSETT